MSAENCTERGPGIGDCPGVVPVRFGLRLTAPYGGNFHANDDER
jgi:hypothetical protein